MDLNVLSTNVTSSFLNGTAGSTIVHNRGASWKINMFLPDDSKKWFDDVNTVAVVGEEMRQYAR